MGALLDALTGKASKKAAKAEEAGRVAQQQTQERAFGLVDPFIQTGLQANQQLGNALGLGTPQAEQQFFANFQNSPQFQAAISAGNENVLNNASATGTLASGGTLRGLQEVGQRAQNFEFNALLDRLTGGRQAGLQAGAIGGNILQGLGASQAAQGAIKGQGIVGQANAIRGNIGEGLALAAKLAGGFA